jgi:hypothetical protein
VILTNESPNTNATVDVHMGGAARGDVYLLAPAVAGSRLNGTSP